MISVITPCLNAAQYIEETIDSVLSQQDARVELIILDGGSTDGTIDIIKRHEKHLAYWHSQKDGGQSWAIREGFRLSKGNILCWLNADDYFMPGTLRKIEKEFLDPVLQVVYGDYIVVDEAGRMEAKPKISFDFDICLLFYLMIPQPSCFWRRDIYDLVGGINTKFNYAFDWDLFLKMGEKLKGEPLAIKHVHDIFSVFRIHPESKSVSSVEKFRTERREIRSQFARYRDLRCKKLAKSWQVLRTLYRYAIERNIVPIGKDKRKA